MSVDNLDEDTKNELALGFTYVEVADDENEGKQGSSGLWKVYRLYVRMPAIDIGMYDFHLCL
jgi:hypothetical protein